MFCDNVTSIIANVCSFAMFLIVGFKNKYLYLFLTFVVCVFIKIHILDSRDFLTFAIKSKDKEILSPIYVVLVHSTNSQRNRNCKLLENISLWRYSPCQPQAAPILKYLDHTQLDIHPVARL